MTRPTDPTTGAPERRVIRVSRSTVAAARARVNLSLRLGKPIPPAVAKIAKIQY